MIEDRIPPHSIEAEQSFLGSILLEPERSNGARKLVVIPNLYRDPHRRIFRAIDAVAERGAVADPVTVKDELARTGDLDAAGGPAYIASLLDGVPHSANLEHYAAIIREKATFRAIIESGSRLVEAGFAASDSVAVQAAIEDARRACESLAPAVELPNLGTLLDAPEEPDRPCVAGLLEFGSATLESGAPGTWKTTTGLSRCLCVAAGQDFAGHFRTYQAPVLHVDGEMGERRTLKLYRRLGRGEGIDVAALARNGLFHYLNATGKGQGRDPRAWERIVRERGIGLVMLDPVVALYGGDENDPGVVRAWWERAIRPLLDLGAAVQTYHHDRKGSALAPDTPANATRGSGDWRGAPDLHANIRTEPGDQRLVRVEVTKSRISAEPAPFYLRIEDHEGGMRVRWTGEAQDTIGRTAAAADAVDALLDAAGDGGMERPAILDALKSRYKPRTLDDALSLVRDRRSADTRRVGRRMVYRRLRA